MKIKLKKKQIPKSFSEEIDRVTDLMLREEGDVTTYDEALEIKRREKQRFELTIRKVTENGGFLVEKLMELAGGVTLQKETKNGPVIYQKEPDFQALQLLTSYGFGKPLGDEKSTAIPDTTNKTSISIFLPENNRGDGPVGPVINIDREEYSRLNEENDDGE